MRKRPASRDAREGCVVRRDAFLRIVRGLFEDGPDWPQSLSRFYLPRFNATFARVYRFAGSESKLSVGMHCPHWHTPSIRQAGRIWVEYIVRRVRPALLEKKDNAVAIDLRSFLSPVLLS